MWSLCVLLTLSTLADGAALDNGVISSPSKMMVDDGDFIGNPMNLTWKCTPQVPPPCTFTMPVTISVSDFLPRDKRISIGVQRDMIMRAAKKWEAVTRDLKFDWAPAGVTGDIDIRFAFIDGVGGAIGRAGNPSPNTPEPTWVRLDDAEKWVTHENANLNKKEYPLLWALTHEFGHAIGLRHSSNSADIMFGELQATKAILNAGDIIAAQAFYGEVMVTGGNPEAIPPGVGLPVLSPQVGQELNHRIGVIVDSLPETDPNGESVSTENTGQSVDVNGLILDEVPSTDQRGGKTGRKRSKKAKCTKQLQRINKCRRREKTTPGQSSPRSQTRPSRRVRTRRPSPAPISLRISSKRTNVKSAVRSINSDLTS